MEPINIFVMGLSISRLFLLTGIYIGGSSVDTIYVSTMLDSLVAFKIVLTHIIILETMFCVAYLTLLQPVAPKFTRVAVVILSAGISVCGWTVLASYQIGSTSHQVGTICFMVGSAGIQVMLIERATHQKKLFAALWTAIFICGVTFLITSFTKARGVSALVEWIGFMIDAAALALYFYDNPVLSRGKQTAESNAGIPLLEIWGDGNSIADSE